LNPATLKQFLSSSEIAKIEEIQRSISVVNQQFAEYLRLKPELSPQRIIELKTTHQQELVKLKDLYTQLVRQTSKDVPNNGQFEMADLLEKIDPSAKVRNEEIIRQFQNEVDQYWAILQRYVRDMSRVDGTDSLEDVPWIDEQGQ
jgi:hypothetical protein